MNTTKEQQKNIKDLSDALDLTTVAKGIHFWEGFWYIDKKNSIIFMAEVEDPKESMEITWLKINPAKIVEAGSMYFVVPVEKEDGTYLLGVYTDKDTA